ncbi:hypothetical protein FACS18949_16330 [Clostridia bacterium]|nr:hypothetical protein FACS18949_16330 [Clostridia bacterium]
MNIRFYLTQSLIAFAYFAALSFAAITGNPAIEYWTATLGFIITFCAFAAAGLLYKKGSHNPIFFSVAVPLFFSLLLTLLLSASDIRVPLGNEDYSYVDHIKIGALLILMTVQYILPLAAIAAFLSLIKTGFLKTHKRYLAGLGIAYVTYFAVTVSLDVLSPTSPAAWWFAKYGFAAIYLLATICGMLRRNNGGYSEAIRFAVLLPLTAQSIAMLILNALPLSITEYSHPLWAINIESVMLFIAPTAVIAALLLLIKPLRRLRIG